MAIKLAEAYIHLKIDTSNEFREAAKSYFYHHGKALASEIFRTEVNLLIWVEDSSFKARATVAAAAIYVFRVFSQSSG